MIACDKHNDVVVIYEERQTGWSCPLCEKTRDFNKLEMEFDQLEKENAGLKDEVKELSRIIDEKGLV